MPADTPVNVPVVPSMVATAGLPLVHTPPVTVLLNVDDSPTHTPATPVIADGTGLTVTVCVAIQPEGTV